MYYLNIFILYSILGFLIESVLMHAFNSGIMYGPWTIVYGFGTVVILIIGLMFKNLKINKSIKVFLQFVVSGITLSILELIAGYIILYTRHIVYWDYTSMHFNIGRFISLETSIIWGILSIIIYYVFLPLTNKFIKKTPKYLTFLLLIAMIIDFIFSIIYK
ncbi:MAG: putative ABC transporter permease [Bacilli bacterium]|nr:putative ABC transporter permease [Bacilli bacterium]